VSPANTTNVLGAAIKVVAFLMAAFGGFLTNIAPPEETGIKLVLGLASLACLIFFLFISAVAKDLGKRWWLIIAAVTAVVFIVGAVAYQQEVNGYTFTWEATGVRYVDGGEHYTADAQTHAGNVGPQEFVQHYGGMAEGVDSRYKVWTSDSIAHARLTLTLLYLLTVLSAAIAVFALTEGALPVQRKPAAAKAPAAKRAGSPAKTRGH
jgi:hypothetical protein